MSDGLDGRIDRSALETMVEQLAGDRPFSGVARVSVDGTIVMERAWGYRDRATGAPCGFDTAFGMASGSKTFTAVAVCRMVEEGALSLDDSLVGVSSLDLSGIDPRVTVRNLLTHTSGVADYFDEEEDDDFEALWVDHPASDVRTPRDVFELFRGKGMKRPPGERFAYSNAGFVLLGLILEEQAGVPFARCIEESVFAPAGMADSGYFAMDALPSHAAIGYVRTDDGWRDNKSAVPVVGQPDGGAFTTLRDMDRFWDALLGGRLLSQGFVEELLGPAVDAASEGPGAGYGYGVWTQQLPDGARLHYAMGSDPGVGFESGFTSDRRVRVTVVRNTDGPCYSVFSGLVGAAANVVGPDRT